jgi:hypothetical protein
MTPTIVQCIDCARFDLRQYPGMARAGYGRCALETRPAHFDSATFERHCPEFEAAPPELAALRRKWLAAEHEKLTRNIRRGTA